MRLGLPVWSFASRFFGLFSRGFFFGEGGPERFARRRPPDDSMPLRRSAVPPKFISRQVAEARRFYLNLRPAATEGITVICGGGGRSAPAYRVQPARFPLLFV